MNTPLVTVIVPCLNEGGGVLPTLESIVTQRDADGRPFAEWAELIVTDDDSTDATPAVLSQFQAAHPYVVVLRNVPRRGISGSLNRAIGESRAFVVLSCHADCRLIGTDYVWRALRHFEQADVAGVTGKPATPDFRALSFVDQLFILTHVADVDPEPPAVRQINFLETRCETFRKQALVEVGLYDEFTKLSGEDQILAIKLAGRGYRVLQDTSLLYTLCCGSSQDSVRRIIRRHSVYAEAQSYLILRYGLHTIKAAVLSPNRLRRKRLRGVQVAYPFPLVVVLVVLSVIKWPFALAVLAGALLARGIYHIVLGRGRFGAGAMLCMFPVVIACDFVYAWGFARGVVMALLSRNIG